MALLECKMCGGNLEATASDSVYVCDFCGTEQTLPVRRDEEITNLFKRANHFRRQCDFDKAEQAYDKILDICSDEPEAYWGKVLCKYGIEYVEDPKTGKRIPTCHRAMYEAVIADTDYQMAIEKADLRQKAIYEAEAAAIDKLQRDILEVAGREPPFDVFICYKETDENGKRTVDSVYANDIYHCLVSEGFRVFYAAITLEDKLGEAYEPYIFSALNSARVMLVIGTRPEYFEAVWVRNEWSRFLRLVKKDSGRRLIPCYRDMDAYDLPDAFSHLQAQDMSKLGFVSDLVRGIKKIVAKEEAPRQETVHVKTVEKVVPAQAAVSAPAADTDPLLRRMFMLIEDGDFIGADGCCEKVLNADPTCARAYLGKLFIAYKAKGSEALAASGVDFTINANYQKILRYGDDALRREVEGYVTDKAYFTARALENAMTPVKMVYNEAMATEYMNELDAACARAVEAYEELGSYRDSEDRIKQCHARAKELREDMREKFFREIEETKSSSYIRDYLELFPDDERVREMQAEHSYKTAVEYMEKSNFAEAASYFEEAARCGYLDSADKAKECYYQRAMAYANEGDSTNALWIVEQDGLVGWRDAEKNVREALEKHEKVRSKRHKSKGSFYSLVAVAVCVLGILFARVPSLSMQMHNVTTWVLLPLSFLLVRESEHKTCRRPALCAWSMAILFVVVELGNIRMLLSFNMDLMIIALKGILLPFLIYYVLSFLRTVRRACSVRCDTFGMWKDQVRQLWRFQKPFRQIRPLFQTFFRNLLFMKKK